MRKNWFGFCLSTLLLWGVVVWGEETNAKTVVPPAVQAEKPAGRFGGEIAAFAEMDRKNSWPAGAVLFVGSSSIRMWATREAFPDLPVINRGFGGATIPDVLENFERVVSPYGARVIVFYCGENDIGGGRTPEQVCADFHEFVRRVRENDKSGTTKARRHEEEKKSLTEGNEPASQSFAVSKGNKEEKKLNKKAEKKTKIIYMAMKPSESRWGLWPKMQRANELIGEWIKGQEGVVYFDAASILMKEGRPNAVYFETDQLHLNREGYKIWSHKLKPLFQRK